MKCLWADQLLLEARSPLSNRTRLFFPVSPPGWRGCRCLFSLWPIVTMIYLWALVPGLTLALVQSPAWCCKSFCLMLVCMKGTELQLHLARKSGSRDFSGAVFWVYSGFFLIMVKIPLNDQLILQISGLQHLSMTVNSRSVGIWFAVPYSLCLDAQSPLRVIVCPNFLRSFEKSQSKLTHTQSLVIILSLS